jgi:hypothetical protein
MTFYNTMVLLILLTVSAFFTWINWHITTAMNTAANAMASAAHTYQDAFQNYEAERLRIGMELSQLSKESIRVRELLKKLEHKTPAKPNQDPKVR